VTGLDTNILVRYLTQDDPDQSGKVTRAMEEATRSGEPLFVNHIVLCELVWVLEAVYRLPKPKILSALEHILRTWHLETVLSEGSTRLRAAGPRGHWTAPSRDHALSQSSSFSIPGAGKALRVSKTC
jgi:predicted nucleic acid-binding protein